MKEPRIVAEFEDHRGEKRRIHKTRRGQLQVLNENPSVSHSLTNAAGPLIGARINAARLAAGLTLSEMVVRAGFNNMSPKEYGWALENPGKTDRGAMRFGSLYAIAAALGVGIEDLLPPLDEVLEVAGVSPISATVLVVGD